MDGWDGIKLCEKCGEYTTGRLCGSCQQQEMIDNDNTIHEYLNEDVEDEPHDSYSGYEDDEWYDDGDYDRVPEVWGQSYSHWLFKGKNGKLCMVEGVLTRYEGEDWGEASGWHESRINLKYLLDESRQKLIEFAKDMKPGTATEFSWSWFDDDDESPADPPAQTFVDDIPF